MRQIRHPLSGALYDLEDDGTVMVTKDGAGGRFTATGRWLSGEIRTADPQLCGWIAGAPTTPRRGQHVTRGLSYQELLDTDTHKVPEVLRLDTPTDLGSGDIPVVRYTTREFHELEVERLWKQVWQMACREEDIPEVGDTTVYTIAHLSILIVRSGARHDQGLLQRLPASGTAAARRRRLHHRAPMPVPRVLLEPRRVVEADPVRMGLPARRPRRDAPARGARSVRGVGSCSSTSTLTAAPLDAFLGDLRDHFARWPLEQRYKEAHVAKVLRCNWKVAQEAFMEAFHVVATHPQLLAGIGDANSQYDVCGSFSRAITPNGTPSPHLSWTPTEQELFDAMTDRRLDEPPALELPDGMTARDKWPRRSADLARTDHRRRRGRGLLCDAELVDSIYYTVFPNFHPWGAYNRITYRFRPYGDRHDKSIMECMYLTPFVGERPPSAPVHWLGRTTTGPTPPSSASWRESSTRTRSTCRRCSTASARQ